MFFFNVCVHACTSGDVVCVHMCGAQSLTWAAFLNCFLHYFLRQGLSLSPGDSPVLTPQDGDAEHGAGPAFNVGSGHPN